MTEASVKLASALTRGETMEDYAARAGISVNTAKFHLKAVFRAMGVSRQSEVVRLAGALIHDLA